MELRVNHFKRAIKENRLQVGLWSGLSSNVTVEVLANAGFDWMLLDTEHSPNELPMVHSQLQAIAQGSAHPIVRPAWNDTVIIKRFLDVGAQTLLIPFVQSPEEAKRAVEATRYPPKGVRGLTNSGRASRYGRVKDYVKNASSEICLLVQVETREALKQIEAIASVDGVDGVFIGPADLSNSFGYFGNWNHPELEAAFKDAGSRIRSTGKAAGFLTANEEEAKKLIGWGFNFMAVGSDLGLLTKNADALAKRFKPGT